MSKRLSWLVLGCLVVVAGCAGLLNKKKAFHDDQGMTSDVHKEKVGKIVFASEEIEKGKEDPDSFKKTFTLGEPIYARLYLARSLYNSAIEATGKANNAQLFTLKVSVDGEELESVHKGEMDIEWTTYKFVIVRGPDDTKPWDESAWFAKDILPELTEGTRKVKIELWGRDGDTVYSTKPLAVGSFKLEVGDDVAKVVKKIQKLDTDAGESRAAAAKADIEKHLAAGERWVNFNIGFCFKTNPMFEWSHKGSSGNAGSGSAMWLPIGAKVELCQDAARTGCRKFATITDEEDQRIEYECPH